MILIIKNLFGDNDFFERDVAMMMMIYLVTHAIIESRVEENNIILYGNDHGSFFELLAIADFQTNKSGKRTSARKRLSFSLCQKKILRWYGTVRMLRYGMVRVG